MAGAGIFAMSLLQRAVVLSEDRLRKEALGDARTLLSRLLVRAAASSEVRVQRAASKHEWVKDSHVLPEASEAAGRLSDVGSSTQEGETQPRSAATTDEDIDALDPLGDKEAMLSFCDGGASASASISEPDATPSCTAAE